MIESVGAPASPALGLHILRLGRSPDPQPAARSAAHRAIRLHFTCISRQTKGRAGTAALASCANRRPATRLHFTCISGVGQGGSAMRWPSPRLHFACISWGGNGPALDRGTADLL